MLTITFCIDWLASLQLVSIVANVVAIALLGIKSWRSVGSAEWDVLAVCLAAVAINCALGIVVAYCLADRLRDRRSCRVVK